MTTIRARAAALAILALLASSACGRGQQEFARIPTGTTPPGSAGAASCTRDTAFLQPDPGALPAGVPFPTPVGARVKPGITGVPLPPGSVEVDGFEMGHAPVPRSTRSAVQVFDVALSETEVLAFFDESFRSRGWIVTGVGGGPNGTQCTFVPSGTTRTSEARDWIVLSTAYIPRKEDEKTQPPPGFRGKAVPFAPANPGLTRFWLITPK